MNQKEAQFYGVLAEKLAREIVRQSLKVMVPHIKAVIKEEIDRKFKDLVYENVVTRKHKNLLDEDFDDEDIVETKKPSKPTKMTSVKSELARRVRTQASQESVRAAREIYGNETMSLIESAQDPEQMQSVVDSMELSRAGTVRAEEVGKKDIVDPVEMDYSALLPELGDKQMKLREAMSPIYKEFDAEQKAHSFMFGTKRWGLFSSGGSVGSKPGLVRAFDSKEEANAAKKRYTAMLSPGEKQYYKIKYYVEEI